MVATLAIAEMEIMMATVMTITAVIMDAIITEVIIVVTIVVMIVTGATVVDITGVVIHLDLILSLVMEAVLRHGPMVQLLQHLTLDHLEELMVVPV